MRQLFYIPLHGPRSVNDQGSYHNRVSAPGACHAIGVAVQDNAYKLVLVVEGDDRHQTRSADFAICGLMSEIPFEAGHIGTTSMVVQNPNGSGPNVSFCWTPVSVYQLSAWE